MSDVTSAISRSGTHCVDANLVIRRVGPSDHPGVADLWSGFAELDTEVIAPTLLPHDVANAVHRECRAGRYGRDVARALPEEAIALPIELHGDAALHVRALELAGEHDLRATYDAHYLALAERYRVPLWTCDRRLHDAVGQRLPWVHLVS